MSETVKVRVVIGHQHVGDIPDFHQWLYSRPVKCDRRGVSNPLMREANWQKWICNNTDCPAFAFVSNDAIRDLIEAAS